MKLSIIKRITLAAFLSTSVALVHAAADMKSTVDEAIQPVMKEYDVAGMAVGIVDGERQYVFNYGMASTETRQPVTDNTLFEIGSISKTLTATLTSYAQLHGYLSLPDPTSHYLPALRNSEFGKLTLLELGTHTPGGLPLQVPDDIHNDAQLIRYFKAWRPTYAPGTYRTYSNPGIGTLGLIAAKSMGRDFDALMDRQLLPALGLKHTYIQIPAARTGDYAQGYSKQNAPIRMKPDMLWEQAYGIRTTAADMTRFVAENMNLIPLEPTLQRAISQTHTGYFTAGALTQDLIWEQYSYPVLLKTLLDGNAQAMALNATPAKKITPPLAPSDDVWINKTGSTNGFGSYIAFIPQKKLGIVILANRNIPNEARVNAAYAILDALANTAR